MEEERITAEKVEKTEKKVKIDIDRYRAKEGEKISLKKFSTNCDMDVDKEYVKTVSMTAALEELSLYQAKLYAQNTYGLIIVLQAMDAAGKDGTIKHVFSHLDPNGVHVVSFKQPTTEEKDHDYMWRINKALPRRGNIGIFNRSHYEDVVVTRVHDLIENDKIPKDLVNKNIWKTRYRQIRDWERYLAENGFHIIKIFLHVSKDEQRDRLAERILNKKKNWKFSIADINERRFWDRYQDLYSEMIEETSTEKAPWYIVPADNKWFTRYVVSQIVLKAMKDIAPKFPEMSKEIKDQLEEFKKLIESGNIGMIEEMQDVMKGGNKYQFKKARRKLFNDYSSREGFSLSLSWLSLHTPFLQNSTFEYEQRGYLRFNKKRMFML